VLVNKPVICKRTKATANGRGKSGQRIQRLRQTKSSYQLEISQNYEFANAARQQTRANESVSNKWFISDNDPIDIFYEVNQEKVEETPMMVALTTPEVSKNDGSSDHRYDADSFLIAIENCCTKSITN
jgi:hypothetical protein